VVSGEIGGRNSLEPPAMVAILPPPSTSPAELPVAFDA
jgi:hypothetical protein